jgi:hypothetical protein
MPISRRQLFPNGGANRCRMYSRPIRSCVVENHTFRDSQGQFEMARSAFPRGANGRCGIQSICSFREALEIGPYTRAACKIVLQHKPSRHGRSSAAVDMTDVSWRHERRRCGVRVLGWPGRASEELAHYGIVGRRATRSCVDSVSLLVWRGCGPVCPKD